MVQEDHVKESMDVPGMEASVFLMVAPRHPVLHLHLLLPQLELAVVIHTHQRKPAQLHAPGKAHVINKHTQPTYSHSAVSLLGKIRFFNFKLYNPV
jgi:hypothetical protein